MALFHSPLSALWVIITFLVIQQVEGHILVPVIMGSRFRVHPLVVIFAILAGSEIHGIAGMLLAIPLIPLVSETSSSSGRVSASRAGAPRRAKRSGRTLDDVPPGGA